jgi:hypothetical protein
MQALDTFNTAVVSPIYYVMFTSLTILASVIMFKVIHCITFVRSNAHFLVQQVINFRLAVGFYSSSAYILFLSRLVGVVY